MRRRWFRWMLAIVAAAGLLAAALAWRFHVNLAHARRDIAARRHEAARQRLAWIAALWPGWSEVEYQLGVCERALGRRDAALAAWARVPPGTTHAARAAVQRALLLIQDRGEFAAAEEILVAAARNRGPGPDSDTDEVLQVLARVYRLQGRDDDARRTLEARQGLARDPVKALRDLWLFDFDPPAIDGLRIVLEEAGRRAPDDDRVWLGRANLATRSGRLDEARMWLDACLRRRPRDPAVWRGWLSWAQEAKDLGEIARAAQHLPADRFHQVELLTLRARVLAARDDPVAERNALTRLVEHDPGNLVAIERLADLAFRTGQTDRAARLRQRKAELDEMKDRYRKLLSGNQAASRAATLAELAEALGRRFEARGWWIVAARRSLRDARPPAALARLDRSEPTRPPPGRTLAELMADVLATPDAARPMAAAPPGAAPRFVDEADAAGLCFIFDNGATRFCQLPEIMGGGVGLLDYDGDGRLDVYCLQGGLFPPRPPAPGPNRDRLFRNRGDNTFEDATITAGISSLPGGYGHGVAVGDYNNDNHPDLFLTRWRSYALLRNRGDGTFEDATEGAGLGGDRDWPTSAAFADLDNDGDLDLYVCHYLAWDADHPHLCRRQSRRDAFMYCDPSGFPPRPDHLYRNDRGTFVDVTAEAGIVDPDGRGLGVVAADLDDDGLVDLFVANDTTANYLFRNLGGLRFEEVGIASGVASNSAGGFQASMGVACGDLDGDCLIDLAVTNFYGESTTFYQNLGDGQFTDRTASIGLAAPTRFLLGFGVAFFDFNDDGHLDLIEANGHVNDFRPMLPFPMPTLLMAGGPGGRLTDLTHAAGPHFRQHRVGRGLAIGDLDDDGRLDAVLVALGESLALLRNRTDGGRFLALRLEGTASNRDAVGARVKVTAGGRTLVAQRFGGGSYLSASAPELHFGLGATDRADSIEIRWPSGRADTYRDVPAGATYHLREGDTSATRRREPARRGGPPDEAAGSDN